VKSDTPSSAGLGKAMLGSSSRGAAQPAHSENSAPALEGGSTPEESLREGCQAPTPRMTSASGSGSGASTAPGITGAEAMPPSRVLGDITNIVLPQPQVVATLVRVAPPAAKPGEPCCSVSEGDSQDPRLASEYAGDILGRLLDTELLFVPRPDYMLAQADINAEMRAILIDWLVDVHRKYRLRPETLFLTVNIIDRYLSVRHVVRRRLQLLGVVALFIAAKYEEIDPPRARNLADETVNTYSEREIATMECVVLAALDFQIAVPTPVHFLGLLQRANRCDAVQKSLVQYALELSLLDVRNVRYPPSLLVSAALLVSNAFLGRWPMWPAAMVRHTRRSEASLRACAADLWDILVTAESASLQAVRRKYQLDVNHAVADLIPRVP